MRSSATALAYTRTLDAKPNADSIVKPGELVDIVEMMPLTLNDRRIYNLLVAHAWDEIDQPKKHVIPKRDLQLSDHKGTDRLGDSINRLMSTIVKVRVLQGGVWVTQKVQLLGSNMEPESSDGMVSYEFPSDLRKIIMESTIFARLHRKIMLDLSSKYSLALYEMIQKRGNLNRTFEEISLEDLRGFLGVPKDKLTSWINLKNKALTPAIAEVSALSHFTVSYVPIKGGARQFTGVRLSWQPKPLDDVKQLEHSLDYMKPGRRGRQAGSDKPKVDPVPTLELFIRADTLEKAKRICPGYDVYFIEREWQRWASSKSERPNNSDAAFLAFCKRYVERNPL